MPRSPACQPSEIYEALKDLNFLDSEGKLLPWGHNVWQQAFAALREKMSKDYIYLYLSTNRNDVFRRLHGAETLESPNVNANATSDLETTTDDDSRRDPNWSMGEIQCVLPPLRQAITISHSEWGRLKSYIATYKDREYEVFVAGWTDAVYDTLWSHLRLPCPFAFKNAHINHNPGEIFVSIKGHCSECKSEIHLYCLNEPSDDQAVTFNVSTFDSRGVAHNKKRQIKGENRVRIGKQLQSKSVYAWRRDEANRLMNFGDVEPASLPTEDTARKIKQEALDKELGLLKVRQALASVWDMKYGTEFAGCIHEIGLDKFYLMYWTPTQLYMYNKFMNEDDLCSISIDATGSLVKQIANPAGEKRVVYLYQVVCSYLGKILPLFQWLSEKHDTNTLAYCIREWLRLGGSCPKQVVTDYSLALLNAIALAFNNKDLKSYVENCVVFGKSFNSFSVQRPRTVIRIDIAHLMKLVAGWSCFKHESPHKKDCYLRCVGLLSTCTRVDNFIEICTDVLSLAFSTHENIDDPENHCFAAHNRMMNRLKTFDLTLTDMPENLESSDPVLNERLTDFDNQNMELSGAIDAILSKLKANSTDSLDHGRINAYHCADFGVRLLKLSKQFVLWTAVMTPTDGHNFTPAELEKDSLTRVASSARSEEYFRELKHLVLKKGKALRLDKFLVLHLRALEGTNKLLNARKKNLDKCGLKATSKKLAACVTENPKPKDQAVDIPGRSEVIPLGEVEDLVSDYILDYHSPVEQPEGLPTSDTIRSEDVAGHSIQSVDDHTRDQSEIHYPENLERNPREVSTQSKDTTVDSVTSEMSYLNEIEPWKLGHLINPPKPKKRGKYVTACPDIEIIHKRPKCTSTLPLLLNGISLKPVKIRQQMVHVKYTCAFDTSIQSILTGCNDYATYADYLADCNFEIYEFVQKMSTTGVTAALYTDRGSILSTVRQIKDGALDCTTNISHLHEKVVFRDVPSLVRTIRCADCLNEVTKTLPVLHLDPLSLYRSGMAGLQESLDKTYTYRSSSTCFKCKSANITKGLSGGSHLMISIEEVGNALLASRNGYPDCRRTFTLLEIPDKLVYDGYTYKFVSAIIHEPGHYFAMIKRVTGKWEEHNDLRKQVMAVTARKLLQQHDIHGLFYIRISRITE